MSDQRMIRVRVDPETYDLLVGRATAKGVGLAPYVRTVLIDRARKIKGASTSTVSRNQKEEGKS